MNMGAELCLPWRWGRGRCGRPRMERISRCISRRSGPRSRRWMKLECTSLSTVKSARTQRSQSAGAAAPSTRSQEAGCPRPAARIAAGRRPRGAAGGSGGSGLPRRGALPSTMRAAGGRSTVPGGCSLRRPAAPREAPQPAHGPQGAARWSRPMGRSGEEREREERRGGRAAAASCGRARSGARRRARAAPRAPATALGQGLMGTGTNGGGSPNGRGAPGRPRHGAAPPAGPPARPAGRGVGRAPQGGWGLRGVGGGGDSAAARNGFFLLWNLPCFCVFGCLLAGACSAWWLWWDAA
uniref:Uncharacterized protein n=1 Tax=Cairina moschata TaxID=8855 RepID=A0A8C3C2B3_CAIMO